MACHKLWQIDKFDQLLLRIIIKFDLADIIDHYGELLLDNYSTQKLTD